VAIFFVVSGFCIHYSFARHPNWSTFFRRRFFRIYPPYLAALLFFSFVYPLTRLHFASRFDIAQFCSHVLLLHNFDARSYSGIVPAFWSIAVEVQLYALYPVLIALIARFGWRRSLVSIALLEVILRVADGILLTTRGSGLPMWVSGSPFIYWFSWSVGAAVAESYLRGQKIHVSRISLFALGALAVGSCCFRPSSAMSFLLFALLTAGVVTRFLQDGSDRIYSNLFWSHLQRVGLWSYSLYLLHQPLLSGVPRLTAKIMPRVHIHPWGIFTLCLASWFVIVYIGKLSYEYCELPSIALGKSLGRSVAPDPTLPPARLLL
jgi:peptidoglycan/LPS O-acetylase OafA/YrhL